MDDGCCLETDCATQRSVVLDNADHYADHYNYSPAWRFGSKKLFEMIDFGMNEIMLCQFQPVLGLFWLRRHSRQSIGADRELGDAMREVKPSI